MKWIFTPAICFFITLAAIPTRAQSDPSRYADCLGTYQITTPSFPVGEVTIYWKDTTLAYKAGSTKGLFQHQKGEKWRFVNDDHEGNVTFTKNVAGKASGILIVMDGEKYEGIKEKPAGKDKQ